MLLSCRQLPGSLSCQTTTATLICWRFVGLLFLHLHLYLQPLVFIQTKSLLLIKPLVVCWLSACQFFCGPQACCSFALCGIFAIWEITYIKIAASRWGTAWEPMSKNTSRPLEAGPLDHQHSTIWVLLPGTFTTFHNSPCFKAFHAES